MAVQARRYKGTHVAPPPDSAPTGHKATPGSTGKDGPMWPHRRTGPENSRKATQAPAAHGAQVAPPAAKGLTERRIFKR